MGRSLRAGFMSIANTPNVPQALAILPRIGLDTDDTPSPPAAPPDKDVAAWSFIAGSFEEVRNKRGDFKELGGPVCLTV